MESVNTDAHVERDFIFVSEVWRAIPGFSNYEASTLGNIRHARIRRVLPRERLDPAGYRSVRITADGAGQKSMRVHRLVWLAHKGPIPRGMVLDHINADRSDSRLGNLRPATYSDNQQFRWDRIPPAQRSKKLTPDDYAAIKASKEKGVDLAAAYKVSMTTISEIRRGRRG